MGSLRRHGLYLPQRGFSAGLGGLGVQSSGGRGSHDFVLPHQSSPHHGAENNVVLGLEGPAASATLAARGPWIHQPKWGPLYCPWVQGSRWLSSAWGHGSASAPQGVRVAKAPLQAAGVPTLLLARGPVGTQAEPCWQRAPGGKPVMPARDLWEGVSPGEGEGQENRQARDHPTGAPGHRLYHRVLPWGSEASLVSPWGPLPGWGCPGGWPGPP